MGLEIPTSIATGSIDFFKETLADPGMASILATVLGVLLVTAGIGILIKSLR